MRRGVACCQECLWLLAQTKHVPRAAPPLAGKLLDARLAQRDERNLGSRKDRVEDDESEDDEELGDDRVIYDFRVYRSNYSADRREERCLAVAERAQQGRKT